MSLYKQFKSLGRGVKAAWRGSSGDGEQPTQHDHTLSDSSAQHSPGPPEAENALAIAAPNIWATIGQQAAQITDAAQRMNHVADPEPEPTRPLSRIEQLPEEILLQILHYLDHGSLYRMSQISGVFLRVSFDRSFEEDADWRTFRHTVDCLSDGPLGRLRQGG